MTTGRRSLRRRLLAGAIGCGIALLSAEVALRALGLPDTNRLFLSASTFAADDFASDPDLFWRLSARHPQANEVGLRGPWFETGKEPREYRILAVGDSCTYGSAVAWEETWGVQLERAVQASCPDRVVRVGIAAVPGYSTFQDERLLARVLPTVAPDLVVFYCGAWNDQVPASGANDARLAAQLATSRLFVMTSALFQPTPDALRAAFERGETPAGRRVPVDEFERRLVAMAKRCRTTGAAIAFVAPWHPPETQARFPALREYRDAVRRAAVSLRAPLVDLAEVCANLDPSGAPPLPGHSTACFADWVHPAANLHAALARALFDRLGLPQPRPATAPLPRLEDHDGDVVIGSERDRPLPLRVWLGARPTVAHLVGGELRAAIPVDLAPGEHVLQIVDRTGARTLGRVTIAPPVLRATRAAVAADVTRLVVSGAGEPKRIVLAWVARERLDSPLATPFGAFELVVPGLGEPVAGVLRFDLATTGRHHTIVGADGTWTIDIPIATEAGAAPRKVHVQALIVDPATLRAALTDVATITYRP